MVVEINCLDRFSRIRSSPLLFSLSGSLQGEVSFLQHSALEPDLISLLPEVLKTRKVSINKIMAGVTKTLYLCRIWLVYGFDESRN